MYGKKMLKTDATKTLLVDAEKAEESYGIHTSDKLCNSNFFLIGRYYPRQKEQGITTSLAGFQSNFICVTISIHNL